MQEKLGMQGQICNLRLTRFRCNKTVASKYLTQVAAGISCDMLLSCNKYDMDSIIAKESNHKNRVHAVKTHYTVESKHTLAIERMRFLASFSFMKFSQLFPGHFNKL